MSRKFRQAARLSAVLESGVEIAPNAVASRVAQDDQDAAVLPVVRNRMAAEVVEADALARLRMASCAAWNDRARGRR